MQTYSPNMLKTFAECEKKYELKYIKKINVPQPAAVFEKGKKIHALANYYLKGEDINKFLKTLTDEELQIWEKLLANEFFQKKYVNSEYNLTARLGNYWFNGRIDALMKSDNNYYILDYKTGSIPKNPETDYQTIIYLVCAQKILEKGWGENFSLKFIYIDLKNNKNHIIEFDKNKNEIYEKELIKICDKLTTIQIYNKNPDRCKYCEYNKLCNKN